jgi:hypothetical protein
VGISLKEIIGDKKRPGGRRRRMNTNFNIRNTYISGDLMGDLKMKEYGQFKHFWRMSSAGLEFFLNLAGPKKNTSNREIMFTK